MIKRKLSDVNSILMYKQLLEKPEKYILCNYEEGPLGVETIEAELYRETVDVSSDITNIFTETLRRLGTGVRNVSDISIGLDFSIFVDCDSLDENGQYTESPKVLNDKISVIVDSISGHYNGEKSFEIIGDDFETLFGNQQFTTDFSTLVIGLNKLGFELGGISSFGEVKERVLKGEKAIGTVSLTTEKNKVYKKSEK